MQFQLLAFCLALLGCCLFVSTGAVPTVPKDVSGEVEVLDERKEGLTEIAARLPAPAAMMIPKKRGSLRSRSHGPGGDSDDSGHSDSDCAVTRRIRRSLKARAHGPGGDSGDDSHDSDSDRCTDDSDSDEASLLPRTSTSLARRSGLAKRRALRTRSRGPGGDSDDSHDSDSDRCTDDSDTDEGTLARKSKKSKRAHGPGGDSDHSDSDCAVTKKLREAKKAKRSAAYNIEEDLA